MSDNKSSDHPMKKPKRGRPREIDPRIVLGSADHYRIVFLQFWSKLGARLLAAQSSEEVARAVREEAADISASLDPYSDLILKIVKDPKFPRARSTSQMHFLADSLGGQGFVTPRRAREICAEERAKKRYFIVRREYYIECSCGYKGPALDGACRDCGTGELSWDLMTKDNS
ncbi:MAG: hypothetical protein LAO22_20475 [Acidobacteriia bacterium]|nr:hypothetical protein [Terriglobia bacterium]